MTRLGDKQHIILGHLADIEDGITLRRLHEAEPVEIGFERADATIDSVTRLESRRLVKVDWTESDQRGKADPLESVVRITDAGRDVLAAEDAKLVLRVCQPRARQSGETGS